MLGPLVTVPVGVGGIERVEAPHFWDFALGFRSEDSSCCSLRSPTHTVAQAAAAMPTLAPPSSPKAPS